MRQLTVRKRPMPAAKRQRLLAMFLESLKSILPGSKAGETKPTETKEEKSK